MSEATPGDGVVTVPVEVEEEEMPDTSSDLSPNMMNLLLSESAANMQNSNEQARNTFNLASGALQAGIAKTHNELGPVESRAVSGVMGTPVAGPTNPQGQ